MARNVRNHVTEVYVVDATTKQIICGNLYFNYVPPFEGPSDYGDVIFGGKMTLRLNSTSVSEPFTFNFFESQITALGYDYNSITGNVLTPVYDPMLDSYLYPSAAIITMKKR